MIGLGLGLPPRCFGRGIVVASHPMAAYAPLIGFDAAYESAVGDGNPLLTVGDRSGNGNIIAATSTGPIWRADARSTGLAGIEFTGSSASTLHADGATAVKASAVGDMSCTFVIAGIVDDTTVRRAFMCISDDTNANLPRLTMGQSPGAVPAYSQLYGDGGGTKAGVATDTYSASVKNIWSFRLDGTANEFTFRLNGTPDSGGADTYAPTDTMSAPNRVTFGARRLLAWESAYYDGIMFQAWYWGTALSDATLDDVEDLVNSTVGVY